MINEAIILAGGLGTRLQPVVQNVPKCLAPVNQIPFLEYVLQYGFQQGIERFILSVGYKKESIQYYIASQDYPFEIVFCTEEKPLGTGGAIKKSLELAKNDQVLVLNGDTYFEYNLNTLAEQHIMEFADCTLCLKPMQHFDRYGSVYWQNGEIIAFNEKKFVTKGLVNAGVYALEKSHFLKRRSKKIFSFEKDYLETMVNKYHFEGSIQDAYFIDIGIPEDYERAQTDLKKKYANW
jgi:D-glycero-alpha-D-manno-heptose 1-phosphate guanylyltransferase